MTVGADETLEEAYSASEAAAAIGVSVNGLYRLVSEKRLTAVMRSGRLLISKRSLDSHPAARQCRHG